MLGGVHVGADHVPAHPGLHGDQRHAVRDHVVQLAGIRSRSSMTARSPFACGGCLLLSHAQALGLLGATGPNRVTQGPRDHQQRERLEQVRGLEVRHVRERPVVEHDDARHQSDDALAWPPYAASE